MQEELFNQKTLSDRIGQIKTEFSKEKESLQIQIKTNTDRFNEKDTQEFADFILKLKQENLAQINLYFQEKSKEKTISFSKFTDKFQNTHNNTIQNMQIFSKDLSDAFEALKSTYNRQEQLNENTISKFLQQKKQQLAFKIWKDWKKRRDIKKYNNAVSYNHYADHLSSKCLKQWRNIIYKQACERKVNKTSENDIRSIQQHYLDIVNVLKGKLEETEQLITIKKAAKNEFAYSLSKNLLKAISNLSVEVMSLNQIGLKDRRVDVTETNNFLNQINDVISSKLGEIQNVRKIINQEINQEQTNDTTSKVAKNLVTFQQSKQDSFQNSQKNSKISV